MATTLPPAQRMPLSSSDLRPHLLSPPFFPSASTLSPEPGFSWTASMSPPQQPVNHGGQGRRSSSRSSAASGSKKGRGGGGSSAGGGFKFITASNPDEFKDKAVMTTVRKQAMSHHLGTQEKTTGKSKENHSESSTTSVTDIGSNRDDHAAASTVPTSASQGTPSIVISQKNAGSPVALRSGRKSLVSSAPTSFESRQLIMDRMPLVCPSRDREDDGTPLRYDRHPMPLFVSLGRPLDPFRTMFQTSNPEVSVENLKYQCSMYFGTKALGRYWIPTALSYPHTFLGSLCLATAYNDVIFERRTDSVATITLRQEVIHLVGRNILTADISDPNIMAIIQLVISEFIGREEAALKYHEDGIESMVRHRGGLNQLGLEGRLASSISWISLASSIFREERPKPMFEEHCLANRDRKYQPTAMVPESPLYCLNPRRGFETLNRICSPKTADLLNDMRMMIDLFLDGEKKGRRRSLSLPEYYHKICNYPLTYENNRRYEAVRIAVMIQATAIMQNCPLSQVIQYDSDTGPGSKIPPPIVTRSQNFRLEESPVSPFGPQMSSFSESSTSPAISYSPAFQTPEYFPTHRLSYSSAGTRQSSNASMDTRGSVSTSFTRPSISDSIYSSSDSHFESFPIPTRQSQRIPEQRLHYLKSVIKTSNLSKCWDDEASVLFWIGLVVGAAVKDSQHKLLKQFFSAITMRAGVVLCFEHPEAVNATVYRMTEVVEALSSHKPTPEQKRRRT